MAATKTSAPADTSVTSWIPNTGHILWPMVFSVVALIASAAFIYNLIRRGRYATGLGIGAQVAAVLGSGAVAFWQGLTFYDHLQAWAKPLGGIGSAVVLGAAVVVLLWSSNASGGSSGSGGTTHYHRDTYYDHSSHVSVRDSVGTNVISNSPRASQYVRQSIAYNRSTYRPPSGRSGRY